MDHIEWWARFVLCLLACWRLSELLANEDGPADLFVRLRSFFGHGALARLMDCFQCVSVWVAAPLGYYLVGFSHDWPVAWLAISGGACLLERLFPHSIAKIEFDHASEYTENELLRR